MKSIFNLLDLLKGQVKSDENRDILGIDEAIERVVDGIDTKLRLVPRYRKKLRDEVSLSLSHINTLVDQISGPIDVSRKTFISDPCVRAYFATPDDLQDIFSHCSELKSFFLANEHDECCAMLCANKEEKMIMGMELNDNALQRGVKQTSINFCDYKVLSPAVTDDAVRQGIKMCIFDGLITYALQHIACIKIKRRDLKNERRILHATLRARQANGNGLSTMLAEARSEVESSAQIRDQLAKAEKTLNEMLGRKNIFGFYLDEICNIFSQPEKFIQLNTVCLRLTDMGIKVDEDSHKAANKVYFSELEIINVLKRVVTIVHYRKEDLNFNQPAFQAY